MTNIINNSLQIISPNIQITRKLVDLFETISGIHDFYLELIATEGYLVGKDYFHSKAAEPYYHDIYIDFQTTGKPPFDAYKRFQVLAENIKSVELEAHWTDSRDGNDNEDGNRKIGIEEWYGWAFDGDTFEGYDGIQPITGNPVAEKQTQDARHLIHAACHKALYKNVS